MRVGLQLDCTAQVTRSGELQASSLSLIARAKALACISATTLVGDLGPQASGRNVLPVEKPRCPAISEAHLEAAGLRHGLVPDKANAVGWHQNASP
jgi:hypothetical protein